MSRVIRREAAIDPQEGFLSGVLGFLRISKHPIGQVVNRADISLDQPLKGLQIPFPGGQDPAPFLPPFYTLCHGFGPSPGVTGLSL